MINPFVRLYEAPVDVLTELAYVLLLLAVSVALAGVAFNTVTRLVRAWRFRHIEDKFGPKWAVLPPLNVVGLAAATLFLAAVEAALLAGVLYVVGGGL